MITEFHQYTQRLARLLTAIAAGLLAAMMLVTVFDVCLRWLFNMPLSGTVDLVELFLVGIVFLALPETFLRGEHVTVEIIDARLTPRGFALLRLTALTCGLVYLGAITFNMIGPALDTLAFGDHSMELEIPRLWYWAPIVLGTACAVLAVAALMVAEIITLTKLRYAR